MIRVIGRSRVLLLAALASCVLVAGCGSGPSQVSSAAIVGNRAVTLAQVQGEIQWLLANTDQGKQAKDQRKFDQVSSKLVRGYVLHELTTVATQREGLRADEGKVNRLIDANGGTEGVARAAGVEPARVHEFVTDYLLQEELARKYLDRLSVGVVATVITAEQPGSTAKDKALALSRQIAAEPAHAAEFVQRSGGQVIEQRLSLAEAVQASSGEAGLAGSALFGAKGGSVIAIQPSQQDAGWLVALIKDRTTATAAPPNPALAGQVSENTLVEVGIRLLQPIATELGVRINPRYGVWDEAGMQVAANKDELTGYQMPTRTVQP